MSERAVFVYTTYPSLVEAERIGKAVLERRLAACVNILPGMISHYWWQGTIERGEEVVMIIKTRASLAEAVRAAVKEMHPYDDAGDPGAADRGRGAGVSGVADEGDGGRSHSGARALAREPGIHRHQIRDDARSARSMTARGYGLAAARRPGTASSVTDRAFHAALEVLVFLAGPVAADRLIF